jgi:hypothetical protein
MAMAVDLEALERRVSALEAAQKTNTDTLEWIAGEMGKIKAGQDMLRIDVQEIKSDLQSVRADVARPRGDLPDMIADTMREVLKEPRG